MTNAELRELLQTQTQVLKAEINATTDMLGYKLDEVIKRQDAANHRTSKLEIRCEKYDKSNESFHRFTKNWKVYLVGFGILVVCTGLLSSWISERVDIKKTIQEKTGIKLTD